MLETKNNEMTYRTKREILAAAKYQAKKGRPKKLEPSTARNIRIPDRVWDKLSEPKSETVRFALSEFVSSIK